ncbi:MAG: non-homologous end-joining DNA ligase, partial [Endomicrobiales bacterium]
EALPAPSPARGGGTVEEETVGGVTVRLTNKNKVFWPDEGYTKNDLVSYYRDIAGVILPYLKDRPQSLNRHPDGIYGKSFIQKDVRGKVPQWVRTVPVYSPSDRRELEYLLCQDEGALLYMANLGCIEINPWHSRLPRLEKPDYLVLDFDPLGLAFDRVVETVLVARTALEEAQAPGFCKTSGATGMHVYVPLGGRYSFEQAEEFARIIMLLVNERLPHLTSVERNPLLRKGKVYLDYRQNAPARTAVCAYSLRPRRGAPVSAPLAWEEVAPGLDPSAFTLKTMRKRLEKKGDLWKGVLGKGIDMEFSVERLGVVYRK